LRIVDELSSADVARSLQSPNPPPALASRAGSRRCPTSSRRRLPETIFSKDRVRLDDKRRDVVTIFSGLKLANLGGPSAGRRSSSRSPTTSGCRSTRRPGSS
jgi:hypothetical protein